MNRVDRYLYGQVMTHAGVGLLLLGGLMVVQEWVERPERFEAARGVIAPVLEVPWFLVGLAPVVIALAAIVVYVRAIRAGEVAGCLAVGVSSRRLVLPAGLAGLTVAVGVAVTQEWILPALSLVPRQGGDAVLLADAGFGRFAVAGTYEAGGRAFRDVLVVEGNGRGGGRAGERRLVFAREAVPDGEVWDLRDGVEVRFGEDGTVAGDPVPFERRSEPTGMDPALRMGPPDTGYDPPLAVLLGDVRANPDLPWLRVRLGERLALPLLTVLSVLVAVPLLFREPTVPLAVAGAQALLAVGALSVLSAALASWGATGHLAPGLVLALPAGLGGAGAAFALACART